MDMCLSVKFRQLCERCLSILATLATILATVATVAILAVLSILAIRFGLAFYKSVSVECANDTLQYYEQTDLAKFLRNHQPELLLAQKVLRWACGSIVGVSKIQCGFCELLVDELRKLVKKEKTRESIADLTTHVCIQFQIQDERVCKAVVQEFKGQMFWVLLRLSYSSKEVCSSFLGTDCGGPVTMWNVTFPDVPKPPVVPPSLPQPGSPTIRVLHITDFHLDAEYQAGSNAQCGEPLCCREDDGSPRPGEAGAGKYGDYRECDAAPITVDNLFKHLMSIEDSFDYVIFTGDIPPHNIWNQSKSDQISALDVFTEYALRYLPNKKVFNTLGNHESAPVNSFPPPSVTGNDSESWLYDATAKSWLNWLPAATETTIRKGGFYSVKPFPGLRIVSLNMNMCNNMNWWLYVNATDPAGMLQWFISELQDAENVGDKVHVIGHIYPGCNCCLKPWSYNYYKIVNRYENTITGQFFGHEHSMRYQVFYDVETLKRPLGVSFLPGSITTYTKLNPGYRIYEIDGNYQNSSWRVLDYTNYFMNLTHANLFDEVIWQKEYSAKEAYGLNSLFPQDWNDLIYRMKADDNLFKLFCTHSSKSGPNECDKCTGNCKRDFLCNLKTARNGDPNICKDL